MKIGFLGAGKVARAFGAYLQIKGKDVVGYASRSQTSAEDAARLTGTQAFGRGEDLLDHVDILFITTGDRAIEKASDLLAKSIQSASGKVVAHMSGAMTSDHLKSLSAKGAHVASLHPLQAFADQEEALKQLPQTVFSIEGDAPATHMLAGLLSDTGNRHFSIAKDQKDAYHMTACMVSNYLVTLIDAGLEVFEDIGIERQLGYAALYPLIAGTVENLRYLDTKDALTGPIARGDDLTVKKHLQALKAPDIEALYRLLGKQTVDIAAQKKITPSQARALHALLDDEEDQA